MPTTRITEMPVDVPETCYREMMDGLPEGLSLIRTEVRKSWSGSRNLREFVFVSDRRQQVGGINCRAGDFISYSLPLKLI